ncbi:MAG: hypothetical protein EWV75_12920 [Microcystis wesenbergii Mw_QC_S_20081001_S30D]|jgi:hypothetical protein|uniref:Fe2OG dioxygenase domain-containing protein n=1 Tax=Microcystis wesenbergii Mw_QC_S_20081001_S30D TaxID=2486245 RepID=A0A552JJ01_9CHRO|nr:hypothetical protein [Microcystis sp. Msp_OC_L_20101000_S702]TRU11012.1 MAG: hypothetical protein EWV60_08545 [Microcystis sp. Msp_OC_L_20101000_S702]TRU95773.1 MAG: hypothetical protein EWV75_12920 [Microcystis wesenbergii Mw_QC_S_20081001_S30D]TRV01189.1 MAG: hypothetical protein EWV74_11155 [Microcystis wesenbergii Mw_QC_S_20081001_S30]
MTALLTHSKQFNDNLFLCHNFDNLPLDSLLSSLSSSKFVCIRGLLEPTKVKQSKLALSQKFSRAKDHPTVGESPQDVQTNFQKLAVGCARGKHHLGSYGRLLRVFFNPLWQEDIYEMHDVFRALVIVRNKLIGKPINFASDTIEDGLWTAARIHQYPVGGGFIQTHRDRTQSTVSESANLNYYQVFAILSQKGEDFEQGGGFIEEQGKRIILDDYISPGDIVIYDGSTLHGVEDIDPHKVLDLETVSGRLSAFVSLYKDLSS